MKVPIKWLRDMVDTGLAPSELAQRLTMAGLAAERIEQIGAEWDKVYVAVVRSVERHPNADRLVLADVDAGEHRLTVVTGAPNIAAGQKVALALAGARLIDGHADGVQFRTLKPGMIRGVRSEGMVCSEKELGISDEHEGILVLETDAPVGVPLVDWLGDTVIEFEITPNLVHAFSIHGIAREAGTVADRPIHAPDAPPLDAAVARDGLVTIEAPDLCARYVGVVIAGVQVAPSPAWLTRRLTAADVRPINNVVDITNYVMLELGQPLHAFDRERLDEGRIVVRRATAGEQLETLDHQHRELTPEMLVIADASQPVALAGVIGGLTSEVADGTTTILLESAHFDMKSVRATARSLNVRTEASARFERGLDPNLAGTAAARATSLVLSLVPGSRVDEWQDSYPRPLRTRQLTMPLATIERVLGITIPTDMVLDVLGRLAFQPTIDRDASELTVTVPTWRSDVSIPEDIVEEVARIVGYDHLPATLPSGTTPASERDPMFLFERGIRSALVGAGCWEARSYVTVSPETLKQFGTPEIVGFTHRSPRNSLVTLRNPIRSSENVLRPTLLPSLIAATADNLKHERSVRFFEIAPVYLPANGAELPEQPSTLGAVVAGSREPFGRFTDSATQNDQLDFFDLKGMIETTLDRVGATDVTWTPATHPALHPGRTADIGVSGQAVGIIGELRPDLARSMGIDEVRVCICEIDLASLQRIIAAAPSFNATVPRFLPVEQDFAVVVDHDRPAADVERALRAGAGPLVTGVVLFDVYDGEQLGSGKKSLAFRVTFTAPDRALTDGELGKVRKRIERTLTQQVGGSLRA